ncbi:MAG: translocation/assembly module TamB domain-containing protein, partial [Alphaproteobacteria bacterium]
GTVPVGGGNLALAVKGRLDLAIANTLLATGGARLSGPLAVDVTLSGSMRAPRIAGNMQLTRGRFEDPVNGFFLDRLEFAATGTNDAVTITRLSAVARNGGAITGEGRIELDPAQGFPGRVVLRAQNALLVANETVNAIADARLEFTGALARRPRIAGRVDVRSLEVTIPDRIAGGATMIDVRHINVPANLEASLPKAPRRTTAAAAAPAFATELDLTIAAPVRVFVRGRGVDAELGGELRLRGTNSQPVLSGGFDLKRGRLDLLGKTLAFRRGRMTFPGELDPELDFIAEANADDAVVTVTVSGRASDPKFAFSSTPALPQDEILARLFFGRPSSRLTTGQAIQLAQAAAQLSGAGGPGVLDRLRKRLGVDTLDVGAGPQGNTPQVGVGKRINDRIYLGVRQGATPGSS